MSTPAQNLDPYESLLNTFEAQPPAPSFKDYRDVSAFAQGQGFHVTSTTGGTHNVGSAHYQGRAVDVRSRDKSDDEVKSLIDNARSQGLIVHDERQRPEGQAVWGGPHIHLEVAQHGRPKQPEQDPYESLLGDIEKQAKAQPTPQPPDDYEKLLDSFDSPAAATLPNQGEVTSTLPSRGTTQSPAQTEDAVRIAHDLDRKVQRITRESVRKARTAPLQVSNPNVNLDELPVYDTSTGQMLPSKKEQAAQTAQVLGGAVGSRGTQSTVLNQPADVPDEVTARYGPIYKPRPNVFNTQEPPKPLTESEQAEAAQMGTGGARLAEISRPARAVTAGSMESLGHALTAVAGGLRTEQDVIDLLPDSVKRQVEELGKRAVGLGLTPGQWADIVQGRVRVANAAIAESDKIKPMTMAEKGTAYATNLVGDLAQMIVAADAVGPYAAFGGQGYFGARGQGESIRRAAVEGGKGVGVAGLFGVTEAMPVLPRSATVFGGSYGLEKATGASDEEALKSAAMNTAFSAAPSVIEGARTIANPRAAIQRGIESNLRSGQPTDTVAPPVNVSTKGREQVLQQRLDLVNSIKEKVRRGEVLLPGERAIVNDATSRYPQPVSSAQGQNALAEEKAGGASDAGEGDMVSPTPAGGEVSPVRHVDVQKRRTRTTATGARGQFKSETNAEAEARRAQVGGRNETAVTTRAGNALGLEGQTVEARQAEVEQPGAIAKVPSESEAGARERTHTKVNDFYSALLDAQANKFEDVPSGFSRGRLKPAEEGEIREAIGALSKPVLHDLSRDLGSGDAELVGRARDYLSDTNIAKLAKINRTGKGERPRYATESESEAGAGETEERQGFIVQWTDADGITREEGARRPFTRERADKVAREVGGAVVGFDEKGREVVVADHSVGSTPVKGEEGAKSDNTARVIQYLKDPDINGRASLEDIAEDLGLTTNEATSAVLGAEMSGELRQLPGRRFQLTSAPSTTRAEAQVQERAKVEKPPTRQEVRVRAKVEKVNPRTGFKPSQTEYLAGELEKVADRHIEENTGTDEAGNKLSADEFKRQFVRDSESRIPPDFLDRPMKEPVTIKVPDDGEFRINSAAAANRLHQQITGKPIEGFGRASKGYPSSGISETERQVRRSENSRRLADEAVRMYGEPLVAAAEIRRQARAIPETSTETIRANGETKPTAPRSTQDRSTSIGVEAQGVAQEPTPSIRARSFPKSAEEAGLSRGTNLTYEVVGDKPSVDRANKRIDSQGADRVAADIARTGEPTKDDIVAGQILARKYSESGDHEREVAVINDLADKLTRAGQTVQAASLIDHLSPEGSLIYGQRILNKRGANRTLTKEESTAIKDAAQKVREASAKVASQTAETPKAKFSTLEERLNKADTDARAKIADTKRKMASGELEFLNTGPVPGWITHHLNDLATIGAVKVAKRAMTLARWTDEMVKDFGEEIRPHLEEIRRRSLLVYNEQRDAVQREQTIARVTDGRPEDFTPEQLRELLTADREQRQALRKGRADLTKGAPQSGPQKPNRLMREIAAKAQDNPALLAGASKIAARPGITSRVWSDEMASEFGLKGRDLSKAYRDSYQLYREASASVRRGGRTTAELDAQTELRQARQELSRTYESLGRSPLRRGLDSALNTLGLSRALTTLAPFHAAFKHTKAAIVPHPIVFAKAFVKQVEALNSAQYERFVSEVQLDPKYKYAQKFGVGLTGDFGGRTDLAGMEEATQSNWIHKIPGIKHSGQAFNTMVNVTRFGWFKEYMKYCEKLGYDPDNPAHAHVFKQGAELVNNATGRGSLPGTLDKATPALNNAFFSTRLWASRLKMISLPFDPRSYLPERAGGLSRPAKVESWKTLFGFTGLVGLQMYLAHLAGAQVSFNRDDDNFLQARWGRFHWDATAGMGTNIKYALKLAEAIRGNEKQKFGDILQNYVVNHLAPIPSGLYDIAQGKDRGGRPVYAWGRPGSGAMGRVRSSRVAGMFWPMSFEDAKTGYEQSGLGEDILSGLGKAFGEGTEVYAPRSRR